MDIKQINIVGYGDLYRFYVTGEGEIIAIHFYPFMGTRYEVVADIEDIPQEIIDKLESKLTS